MSLRIVNNVPAINAHRNLTASDAALSKSLERLSSGLRINRAADDAAGLSISQQFRADIASYKVASRNVSEANSLLQVAEGAMDQIGNMLTRLKELATQAASANAGANVSKINAEGNKLIDEIDRIAQSTEYAGTKLLNGTFGVNVSSGGATTVTGSKGLNAISGMESGKTYTFTAATGSATGKVTLTISATLGAGRFSETVYDITAPSTGSTTEAKFQTLGLTLTLNSSFSVSADGAVKALTATASNFQVGAKNTSNDRIGILLNSVVATSTTGLNLTKDQLDTAAEAQSFLTTVDSAISTLNQRRGDVGAAQNRLNYAYSVLSSTVENYTASESVIRDVDMASEMTSFTKNQILMQAGTSMLAQANMSPQLVLSLFQ
jgi:flagellin